MKRSHRVLGASKLVIAAVIAVIAAAGTVGAFLTLQGGGGPPQTTTTGPAGGSNYFTLSLSCSNGEIAEAGEAFSNSGDYCWGWLGTHTYLLGSGLRVESVEGTAKIGPSEGSRSGTLYIEVLRDGGDWEIIKSVSVEAGSTASFSANIGDVVKAVRLRVSPPPREGSWVSIDSSSVSVKVAVGGDEIIHHNCHEGVHEEAGDAKEATGDYCWGWLSTHTYDLGKEMRVDAVVFIAKLGPSGFHGSEGGVTIEVSSDGENWESVYEGKGFVGGPLSVSATIVGGIEARYVRVRSTSGNYIDFSEVYVAAQP